MIYTLPDGLLFIYLFVHFYFMQRPALEFFRMVQAKPLACDLFITYAR